MSLYVFDFLEKRIEEIKQNLLETNSEYALAAEKSKDLMENIGPIIHRERNITITACDCMDIREFLEQEFTQTGIMRQELYKQGYLDCVKLLRMLGVLA